MSERVAVYIDGFNLYFGMKDAKFEYLKWLNIKLLSENILKTGQVLVSVKYFTSRINNNQEKQKRQSMYIDALQTTNISIIYGNYQKNSITCRNCKNKWDTFNEKKTDVNIAVQILMDAYRDIYDTAILISGDSDLVPPIEIIKSDFQNKKVIVVFPPKRINISLTKVADGYLVLSRKILKISQFPNELNTNGYTLRKPEEWN